MSDKYVCIPIKLMLCGQLLFHIFVFHFSLSFKLQIIIIISNNSSSKKTKDLNNFVQKCQNLF